MTDDEYLRPDYLEDLPGRPIEEIRAMRSRCVDVETGLSYLRRLVQAPLDIVAREQAHRAAGEPAELADLVDELPSILADGTRQPGVGRLPQTLEPAEVDTELQAELDALVGDGRVARVHELDDAALGSLAAGLREFEARVSTRRRAFHERIDALQAELTRRYRSGEASVESLLS